MLIPGDLGTPNPGQVQENLREICARVPVTSRGLALSLHRASDRQDFVPLRRTGQL